MNFAPGNGVGTQIDVQARRNTRLSCRLSPSTLLLFTSSSAVCVTRWRTKIKITGYWHELVLTTVRWRLSICCENQNKQICTCFNHRQMASFMLRIVYFASEKSVEKNKGKLSLNTIFVANSYKWFVIYFHFVFLEANYYSACEPAVGAHRLLNSSSSVKEN